VHSQLAMHRLLCTLSLLIECCRHRQTDRCCFQTHIANIWRTASYFPDSLKEQLIELHIKNLAVVHSGVSPHRPAYTYPHLPPRKVIGFASISGMTSGKSGVDMSTQSTPWRRHWELCRDNIQTRWKHVHCYWGYCTYTELCRDNVQTRWKHVHCYWGYCTRNAVRIGQLLLKIWQKLADISL